MSAGLAGISAGCAPLAGREDAAMDRELCVMTYNLRFASTKSPNAWPERRPRMKQLLDAYRPDIMGTQEGVFHQLQDVAADQPELSWVGLGRDGGSRGEFMAIFYRKSRFELREFDHFWLSDTPEVMASSTWGNTNRRMLTWAAFQDRRTGVEFLVWNTHLDHAIQFARERAASLILERLGKISNPGRPLLLLGDFNAESGVNPVYGMLVRPNDPQGLVDTWHLAQERRNGDLDSFNDFGPAVRQGRRIDWILARGRMSVRATEVVAYGKDGIWPSDHFPVAAWLTL